MAELTVLFFENFCSERGQNSLIRSRVEVLCTHSDKEICSKRTLEVCIWRRCSIGVTKSAGD